MGDHYERCSPQKVKRRPRFDDPRRQGLVPVDREVAS
jgi:hypothetical protein